jgi:hypothetical protein
MPSCEVQSFLDFWDGVVHGLERGLMQADDAAQSFDAASAREGDKKIGSRLLTLCFCPTSALQTGDEPAES